MTTKRPPYQFTIRRLLFLSTAVAVCLAAARSIHSDPLFQPIVGTYLGLMVVLAVMRWPVVRAKQREILQRRLDFLEHRRALSAEVREKRRLSNSRKATTVNSQMREPLVSCSKK